MCHTSVKMKDKRLSVDNENIIFLVTFVVTSGFVRKEKNADEKLTKLREVT